MDVTLRQLIAFEAVAHHGHFGRAAESLHLSQPTVSADVRTLERRLGLNLLHRSRAGTVPTEEGARILVLARRVLEEAKALEAEARLLSGHPHAVRLAASPSLVNRLVPHLLQLAATEDRAPDIDVVEVGTGEVVAAVAAGDADVGVGHWLTPTPGTRCAEIGQDELRVLAAQGLVEEGRAVDLTVLSHLRMLVWPRERSPEYHDSLVGICRARGIEPEIQTVESRLSGALSYLLQSGEAFSVVPADFALDASSGLSSAPLDPPASVPLHVAWQVGGHVDLRWTVENLRGLHASHRDCGH